jgi:hypothetical protein
MPKGEPIPSDALPAFQVARDRALQELTTRLADRAAPDAATAPKSHR